MPFLLETDNDALIMLAIAGSIALLLFIGWVVENVRMAKLYKQRKPMLDNLEEREKQIKVEQARREELLKKELEEKEKQIVSAQANRESSFRQVKEEWEKRNKEEREALEQLAKEKTKGFPWLADAYADYYYLQDMKVAKKLETKSHPAYSSAEKVREIAALRKEAERRSRIMNYQMKFYENLFPWIVELKNEEFEEELFKTGDDLSNQIEEDDDDPARKWLTPEEYNKLPSREKYQTALDRYWTKKKSKWEIGRDFERFVGWQYESQGAAVYYQGIIEGFDDLGRDLIVKKVGEVEIVQCKYWSKEKTIHEKHVFQLYGTMTAYEIDHPFETVKGRFVTSTLLSDRARKFAEFLKIQVSESQKLDKYPCIKCNIAQRDGEKIYHLPFDQQYDKTVIEPQRGEFFAWTVAEAEEKGFRRAWRFRGEKKE